MFNIFCTGVDWKWSLIFVWYTKLARSAFWWVWEKFKLIFISFLNAQKLIFNQIDIHLEWHPKWRCLNRNRRYQIGVWSTVTKLVRIKVSIRFVYLVQNKVWRWWFFLRLFDHDLEYVYRSLVPGFKIFLHTPGEIPAMSRKSYPVPAF